MARIRPSKDFAICFQLDISFARYHILSIFIIRLFIYRNFFHYVTFLGCSTTSTILRCVSARPATNVEGFGLCEKRARVLTANTFSFFFFFPDYIIRLHTVSLYKACSSIYWMSNFYHLMSCRLCVRVIAIHTVCANVIKKKRKRQSGKEEKKGIRPGSNRGIYAIIFFCSHSKTPSRTSASVYSLSFDRATLYIPSRLVCGI